MPCAGVISGLLTAVTLVSSGTAGRPTIIGTEAAFPPYVFHDEAGGLAGFDVEVGNEVCRRAALDCEWQVADFDQLIPGVMSGRFDLAISGIAVTPARAESVDFTIAYTHAGGSDYFVGRAGAPAPEAALTGVQAGTIHEAHLRQAGLRFRAYRSESALLDALLAGQVDLAYGPFDRDDKDAFFEANGIETVREETVASDGVGMVVCKGNDPLRARLDGAITEMQEDGTLDALSDRWF
ncbi:ABC transporter substrate-binding protein [Frigidibacter sp. RF13]|uniref:substrate-binding periplasmic protein n=1 Tax=Frigidibacter sp. RF13 TaxID=2997340 RepID=UPI00226F3883|nr:ABC transporter substrate-binding protein [Frigidibacter sp. RF13]MCY1127765.1 ABC transporter substrate-binding protein [Frigidibacter sp. RF13]